MSEQAYPPLHQLADDEDQLDGCGPISPDEAVDELGQLEMVLLGDTPSGTPEAKAKLEFYRSMRDAGDATPDGPC